MSGDLYRDAHVGLRARLGELAAHILDREAEVTDAFWETVPVEERERLDALRAGLGLVQSDVFEDLTRAEGMLAAYLTDLERLLAGLPSLEADWSELPEDVPPPPVTDRSWQTGFLRADAASVIARTFQWTVREYDRDAAFEAEGGLAWLARFRHNGCPFALRATILTSANEEVGEVGMSLVTSIPRALPPLVVQHETLVLTVGKALGLKHEVHVGEPSFDGLFLIQGTQEAANLFLPPNVRNHLLTLARFDVPTLTIHPPARLAMLRWRFEPVAKALDAAIRVLAVIRQTPPSLKFRREGG
ncbi:MAG TPA: hypothetical protein VLT33_10390 [Labilithrix sp.]|nr:hypothetical protein [Labilithrix sp.]